MRGAATLALDENGCVRTQAFDLFLERPVVGADDHGERGAGVLWGRQKHMRQQRLAGQGMHDLGRRGAHARALTGRKYDGQAGSNGHP